MVSGRTIRHLGSSHRYVGRVAEIRTVPCTNCGEQIRFVRLMGGNWAPANPEPSTAGNPLLLDDERAWSISEEDRFAILADPHHVARSQVILMDHRKTCSHLGASATSAIQRNASGWGRREDQRRRKVSTDRLRDTSTSAFR